MAADFVAFAVVEVVDIEIEDGWLARWQRFGR